MFCRSGVTVLGRQPAPLQALASTGTTPHQWILTQRLGLARRVLETTDTSVEQVASQSGFGSAAALRLHFQRSLGTSPTAYRRTFRTENA